MQTAYASLAVATALATGLSENNKSWESVCSSTTFNLFLLTPEKYLKQINPKPIQLK
jgi:hypothetical protein